ncbi:MAG TPA: hypothetical protein VN253_12840 [Kofleriaceae bacterium]|nr:hypothetical protein [Kofleriaceae bacterium]
MTTAPLTPQPIAALAAGSASGIHQAGAAAVHRTLAITPEQLLFTDAAGHSTSLENLIDDGLDGAYRDRVPGFVELLHHEDPRLQLYACRVLVSWGVAEGFERLSAWASAPDRVPWAAAPVEVDRHHGVDAAFERMADAVRASLILDETPELCARQITAARVLLSLYDRKYFGVTLMVVAASASIRDACAGATLAAAEAAVQRSTAPPESFDLAAQAAALLAVVVLIDEAQAVRLGEELLRLHPQRSRVAMEVADALRHGVGPAAHTFVAGLARSSSDRAPR